MSDPTPKPRKVKLQVVKTTADYDTDKVLGKEMFKELYANIYLAGKKKSGKTMLLYNILKRCANKATKVMLYSPTLDKDDTYKEIQKMLQSRGVDYTGFDHFIDPEDGSDLLAAFIKNAKEEAKAEGRDEPPAPPVNSRKFIAREDARMLFGDELPRAEIAKRLAEEAKSAAAAAAKAAEKAKRKKRKTRLSPQFILVFDDLGEDLRKKSISQLLIKNRHYRCKTIILSQWISYLPPTAIRQLDYVILFGGFPSDKLEDLHKKLDLSDSPEEFEAEYKAATAKKYSFLTIDIVDNTYRTKFDA